MMVKIATMNILLDTPRRLSENMNHLCVIERQSEEEKQTAFFFVVSYLTVNIFCCHCINLDVLTR